MEKNKWLEESLQTNIQMYFSARFVFDRFHYSNIYTYAKAIVTYVQVNEEKKEKKTELIRRMDGIHKNPLKYYYEEIRGQAFYAKKVPNVSFARIEYIVYKYTSLALRGATNISKPIYITSRKDIELAELLDIMEFFKSNIHDWLVNFLVENEVGISLEMPNFGMLGLSQVGFNAKRD